MLVMCVVVQVQGNGIEGDCLQGINSGGGVFML